MPELLSRPPVTPIAAVNEVVHGVEIGDPYRWLEDGDSAQTQQWIKEQNAYAREYLDAIEGRKTIEARIREFLEIETYDSVLVAQDRYVFLKRLPHQEQP